MKKSLLIGSIAAILAIGAIIPAMAGVTPTAPEIASAKVVQNGNEVVNAVIRTDGQIPTMGDALIGYGFATDGDSVIVATSHKAVYDNIGQGPSPDGNTFVLGCDQEDIDANLCSADWHLHYAKIQPNEDGMTNNCAQGDARILSLSYYQPGNVIVKGNKLFMQNLFNSTGTVIDAASGSPDTYEGNVAPALLRFHIYATMDPQVCVHVDEFVSGNTQTKGSNTVYQFSVED